MNDFVVRTENDKPSNAREKLRKAIASNSVRAIETTLTDFQAALDDEYVQEKDLELIQLAQIQNEELKSQKGAFH